MVINDMVMIKLDRQEYTIVSFWSGDLEHWDTNVKIVKELTTEQKNKIESTIKSSGVRY